MKVNRAWSLIAIWAAACFSTASGTHFLKGRAQTEYGADSAWFEANVPQFECSDPLLTQIYAYRWKDYKAHIRDIGAKGYVITEFLDDVGWQKWPYAMLNDATGMHIHEGRWIRNRRYMDGLINYLYPGGGNDRHFSESIADATYSYTLATGDRKWAVQFLPAMKHIYNLWDDHFDFTKGLYFIEPLLDATEYTISSIDASGGRDGFRGGDAFRPTINAYMYANALAISRLSALAGDDAGAADYLARAKALKARVQDALWNPALNHFTDRYKVDNANVKYWDFIRGRELAGYIPWAYDLPDATPKYNAAWAHLIDKNEFAGDYGLRTVGPAYQYYIKQYRYLGDRPECQWNGPSWPFQTTQVLEGMANLLNQKVDMPVSSDDYVRFLKQYAAQHLVDGKPDLQEDYNPDKGGPIVGLDRSHHYNHSGFADLIITGLAGLRPRADNKLEINPLVGDGLTSFCLENVPYHGRLVTILWDKDGKRYGRGSGLSVYLDGKRIARDVLGHIVASFESAPHRAKNTELNQAVNIYKTGYPQPTAPLDSAKNTWQAVDGRTWFFPEIPHGWTAPAGESWYEIDFGSVKPVHWVDLAFTDSGAMYTTPTTATIQIWRNGGWETVQSSSPTGNCVNVETFATAKTQKVRVELSSTRAFCLTQISVY